MIATNIDAGTGAAPTLIQGGTVNVFATIGTLNETADAEPIVRRPRIGRDQLGQHQRDIQRENRHRLGHDHHVRDERVVQPRALPH